MRKSALDILNDCAPANRRVRREVLLELKNEGWEIYKVVQLVGTPLLYLDKQSYVILDIDRENRVIFVR